MDVKSHFLLSLYNHPKQVSDQDNLASHIPFLHSLHLSFSHHVHDLKSLQGLPRRLEGEKAHPRFPQAFDESLILFDQVVEVFHESNQKRVLEMQLIPVFNDLAQHLHTPSSDKPVTGT